MDALTYKEMNLRAKLSDAVAKGDIELAMSIRHELGLVQRTKDKERVQKEFDWPL